MRILISFDIDGTLEAGDPPGRVTMEMVRRAKEMGYIIGSASDRPVPVQKMIWERHGIIVDFTGHKHKLDEVRLQFEADVYQHIGDTYIDQHYAEMHGFEFLDVALALEEPWMMLDEIATAPADQLLSGGLSPSSTPTNPDGSSELEDIELMEANAKGAQALAELWARRMQEQTRRLNDG